MKHVQLILLGVVVLFASASIGQVKEADKQPRHEKSSESRAGAAERGQQVFAQNCSRCHNAPEGFSSRISGTIARHMRVRASLSDGDYRALLRFLNPE
jgi:cytochrome c5